jgi:uncharacterized protein YkwD
MEVIMKITKEDLKQMVRESINEQMTLPPPKMPSTAKPKAVEISDGENLSSNETAALEAMAVAVVNKLDTKKSALKLLTILQKSIEEGFFDKKLK